MNNLMTISGITKTLAVLSVLSLPAPQAEAAAGFLRLKNTVTAQVTPTTDPETIIVLETGVTESKELGGEFTYTKYAVNRMNTRGPGKGTNVGVATLTAPNGDKIFLNTHAKNERNGPGLKWAGTWEFIGGTGRFENIRGHGELLLGGIPSMDSKEPFNCNYEGIFFY
jgi:hypothetical protein